MHAGPVTQDGFFIVQEEDKVDAQSKFIRPGIDFEAFEAHLQAVHATDRQRRCDKMQEEAAESGIKLPMSPEMILTFEDAGAVVDLVTGLITWPNGVRAAPVFYGEVVVDIVPSPEEA